MAETMPTETGIPFWIAWLLALRLKPLETGPHRQVRGSTERPHSRVLEREGMDHEQRSTPQTGIGAP